MTTLRAAVTVDEVTGNEPEPDQRSEAELAALVDRHQPGVWRFLRALGADAALAEELAAAAFLLAWSKGLRWTDERQAAGWLVSTARFLWLRTLRERRRAELALAESAEALWRRYCVDDGGDAWLDAQWRKVATVEDLDSVGLDCRALRVEAAHAPLLGKLPVARTSSASTSTTRAATLARSTRPPCARSAAASRCASSG